MLRAVSGSTAGDPRHDRDGLTVSDLFQRPQDRQSQVLFRAQRTLFQQSIEQSALTGREALRVGSIYPVQRFNEQGLCGAESNLAGKRIGPAFDVVTQYQNRPYLDKRSQ